MAATFTLTAGMTGTDSTSNEVYSLQLSTTKSAEYKDKRNVSVTTTLATILNFGAAMGAGQLIDTDGMLFINRDSTNFIKLGFIVSASKAFYVKLLPNRPFFLWAKSIDTNVTGGAFAAFTDITSITVQADTAACLMDYLIID